MFVQNKFSKHFLWQLKIKGIRVGQFSMIYFYFECTTYNYSSIFQFHNRTTLIVILVLRSIKDSTCLRSIGQFSLSKIFSLSFLSFKLFLLYYTEFYFLEFCLVYCCATYVQSVILVLYYLTIPFSY